MILKLSKFISYLANYDPPKTACAKHHFWVLYQIRFYFPVLLENDQSVSLCFLASPSPMPQTFGGVEGDEIGWGELWLNQPRIPDIPFWRLALSKRPAAERKEIDGNVGENFDELRPEGTAVILLKMLW